MGEALRDSADYLAASTPRVEACERDEFFDNLASLPETEQTKTAAAAAAGGRLVSIRDLFSFADTNDKLLMLAGALGAIGAGLAQPLQIVLLGDMINAFNPRHLAEADVGEMRDDINRVALNFVFLGLGLVVEGFLQVACWSLAGSRQAKRIRSAYVQAIFSNEVGWFDVNEPMQLATRVADSTVAIQDGLGRKVGDGIQLFSVAISGIAIGLIKGWELALVLLAFVPFIALAGSLSMTALAKATQSGIESYGKAGATAQESLGNIRTVHMLNAIEHFASKYEHALEQSTRSGIKKALAVGWGTGFMFFTLFCTYACGLFYGALKVANDNLDGSTCTGVGCYNGGRVLTVFFSILMGAMALGQAGASVQAIVSARAAAVDVFKLIKRNSLIDPLSDGGTKLPSVRGDVELQNVTFAYPSRPDIAVCRNYSLKIHAGETVALVGASGSGKSTVVSLLERFYDPLRGAVKLDGVDVRELNVRWLREQMGLVSQEPALFATTILENIRYGCPSASDEQVVEAAKMANAYDFICSFPNGFNTEVGERGMQLSGGQKQRIAIARAIVKNPPILLLDEATSALDVESERVVQESLDRLLAASKRTTIVVAHRLSTIRNASRIAVHRGGSIIEIGSHDDLMSLTNGHYRAMIDAQRLSTGSEPTEHHPFPLSPTMLDRSTNRTSKNDAAEHAVSDAEGDSISGTPVSLLRLWKLSIPEWKYLVLGAVGAIVNAAVFPVWGLLLTKMTVLFFEHEKTKHDLLVDARYWALGFVSLGVVFGSSIVVQHYGFGVVAQKLVARVRVAAFRAMLRQDVSWFDVQENSSGALVERLATDSAILQATTSDALNQRLVTFTTLAIGVSIAFGYSWQMTLALLSTCPIMIFASSIQTQKMTGAINNRETNDADTAASSILAEAIGSIRTIASFGMEKRLHATYTQLLDASKRADTTAGVVGGVAFGVSQGVMLLNIAFLFWIGGLWASKGTITFEAMFMVIMVIMTSTFAMGLAAQGATDSVKARKAAARVFQIIDREPGIDATSTAGVVLPHVSGDIEFKNVSFAYPSRPDAQVYKNYCLKIRRGQTVALVGASGSGKSTGVALLERFYDPTSGVVTLDGTDLRDLSLPWMRERISLVSQEPVLFAGTIAENIAMGAPAVTREEVVEAARLASAYDFIHAFPNAFDTEVGDRGVQISGGQKQRIAIARAIVRDPEVLLLDEATSALDSESEQMVQESLDRLLALKQRTTIVVAHRLSTIRSSDAIAVMQDGAIVELGSHDELMQVPHGVYRSLVTKQLDGH